MGMSKNAAAEVVETLEEALPQRRTGRKTRTRRQPRYQVILWNDEDHTYDYVIVMLMELFGFPPEKGFQLAEEVDASGQVILMTTTLEHAELKRDQIHAYGKDNQIDACCGSMWSTIEPVAGD